MTDEVVTDTGLVAVVAVRPVSPLGGKMGVEGETFPVVEGRTVAESPLRASLVVETTEPGPLFASLGVAELNEQSEESDLRLVPVSVSGGTVLSEAREL